MGWLGCWCYSVSLTEAGNIKRPALLMVSVGSRLRLPTSVNDLLAEVVVVGRSTPLIN